MFICERVGSYKTNSPSFLRTMFSRYSAVAPFTFPRAWSSWNSRIPQRWYRLRARSESSGRLCFPVIEERCFKVDSN